MYAYCTLQLKLNNFNTSWDLFDSRILIEKNKNNENNFLALLKVLNSVTI